MYGAVFFFNIYFLLLIKKKIYNTNNNLNEKSHIQYKLENELENSQPCKPYTTIHQDF